MSNIPQISPSIKALISLGLGQNEAILYEILLNNPNATSPLLRRLFPSSSRTSLYYVLANLEQYGLLTTTKQGKRITYQAAEPYKLKSFLTEQEKELERQKETIDSVVSDLNSVYRLATSKPGIKYFEGIEGNKEVLFDSLKATSEIYTFADTEAIEKFGKDTNAEYVKERLSKKIYKKIIAIDSTFSRSHYRNSNGEYTEVRLIQGSVHPFQLGTQIYNNTVSFTTLNEKKMIGVIIEDENIAQFHRSLFEYVWNSLPKFTPLDATDHRPRNPNGPILALN